MGYQLVHTQNNDKSNIWVEQDGREYSFEICNDGGYRSRMAQSYDNMVWSGSLWGGGGIDMSHSGSVATIIANLKAVLSTILLHPYVGFVIVLSVHQLIPVVCVYGAPINIVFQS